MLLLNISPGDCNSTLDRCDSCYIDFERAMNLAVNCQHVGYARG